MSARSQVFKGDFRRDRYGLLEHDHPSRAEGPGVLSCVLGKEPHLSVGWLCVWFVL